MWSDFEAVIGRKWLNVAPVAAQVVKFEISTMDLWDSVWRPAIAFRFDSDNVSPDQTLKS